MQIEMIYHGRLQWTHYRRLLYLMDRGEFYLTLFPKIHCHLIYTIFSLGNRTAINFHQPFQ